MYILLNLCSPEINRYPFFVPLNMSRLTRHHSLITLVNIQKKIDINHETRVHHGTLVSNVWRHFVLKGC